MWEQMSQMWLLAKMKGWIYSIIYYNVYRMYIFIIYSNEIKVREYLSILCFHVTVDTPEMMWFAAVIDNAVSDQSESRTARYRIRDSNSSHAHLYSMKYNLHGLDSTDTITIQLWQYIIFKGTTINSNLTPRNPFVCLNASL